MGSEEKIVFTGLFGDYDDLAELPEDLKRGWRAICFTDDPHKASRGWEARHVDTRLFNKLPNVAVSKCIKLNPQYWLPQHSASLWIDANRTILRPIRDFESRYADDFVTMTHPNTKYKDLYTEIKRCQKHKRNYISGVVKKLRQQAAAYESEGVPAKDGYDCENGVIYRRNVESVRIINMLWWGEFMKRETWRDQLALRYVLWKYGFKIKLIDRSVVSRREDEGRKIDPYFWHGTHKC